MSRVNNAEEKEWISLVSRITAGQDWWTSSTKPIPEKIAFQRFGLQLREEDFQQDGDFYRGFLIRDRTKTRVAATGYSAITNTNKEFRVSLDVWPFQHSELAVVIVPGLYVKIDGEQKDKCEDNTECTRKFTRRYLLPKGCASTIKECNYNKGILGITVEKSEVADKEEKPQKVPITLESWKKIGSKPFDGNQDAPVALQSPEEVSLSGYDSEGNSTEDDTRSTAARGSNGDTVEVGTPKEIPIDVQDAEVDAKVVATPAEIPIDIEDAKVDLEEAAQTSKQGPIANGDSKVDLEDAAPTSSGPIANGDSKVEPEKVVETPKSVPIAIEESKVDPGEVKTQKKVAADHCFKSE